MREDIVVVVSGGAAAPRPDAVLAVPLGASVIAADGGLDHARALGLNVTAVIGDFDSVSGEALAAAEAEGVRLVRHPAEKDATDLELALDAALGRSPERILLLAGERGRLDHFLATLLLLGSPRYANVQVDAEIGPAHVHVIRGARDLDGEPGELVTLLALHGAARGVRTDGLVYPLASEPLEPGSSRGVSNVFAGDTARISVEHGVVLALRPGLQEQGLEEGAS
jgi:thiamine pyrophosphokinase